MTIRLRNPRRWLLAAAFAPAVGCSSESGDAGTGGGAAGNGASAAGGTAGTGGAGGNIFVERISGDPNGCLPRAIATDDGRLRCLILEAIAGSCDCSRPGRDVPAENEARAAREELVRSGACGATGAASCDDFCVCAIVQPPGAAADPASDLHACQNDAVISNPDLYGYCYIDAHPVTLDGTTAPIGNPELVSHCPEASQRRLRFVGAETPAPDSVLFISCAGSTL